MWKIDVQQEKTSIELSALLSQPRFAKTPDLRIEHFRSRLNGKLKSTYLLQKESKMGKKEKAPAYVLGVGMTKFIKPRGKVDYTELGFEVGVLR